MPLAARSRRVFATGAYARIRRQFNMPVGKFEGVEQVMARMVGMTYIMDAARSVTAAAIDAGARPAVPAGILKYHVTEMGRRVANDAMDVQGGKGIMLGPRNYLARGYQSIPIAITVEGANILTRNLIIFGQGAIRCHPFVLREMNAARNPDRHRGVDEFDRALFGHIGFTISNAARAFVMALTFARFESVPDTGATRRYYQHIERFSASFAFATDVAMLALGGYLKKKENISARLGDVLSAMYLASMVLKQHEDQGSPRGRSADRRMGVSRAALPGAGTAAQRAAQLPGPPAGGVDAPVHFPARPHLFRAWPTGSVARWLTWC